MRPLRSSRSIDKAETGRLPPGVGQWIWASAQIKDVSIWPWPTGHVVFRSAVWVNVIAHRCDMQALTRREPEGDTK